MKFNVDELKPVESIVQQKTSQDLILICNNPIIELRGISLHDSHNLIFQHLKQLELIFKIDGIDGRITKDKSKPEFPENGYHLIFKAKGIKFKCRFLQKSYTREENISEFHYICDLKTDGKHELKFGNKVFRGFVVQIEHNGDYKMSRKITPFYGVRDVKDEFVNIKIFMILDGNSEQ